MRRRSKNRIPTLRREAWRLFSEYIRERDHNVCFTCGGYADQAGHFIHARNSVYFDPRNVHAQCKFCNIFKNGNLIEYTAKMIDVYGREVVDELRRKKHEVFPISAVYLRGKIEEFQGLLTRHVPI